MLKKNLFYIVCMANITVAQPNTQPPQQKELPVKIHQLYQLQDVAQTLNRLKPIGNYLLAVPPFIELTGQDIQHFLAAIPSGLIDQRNKKQPISMLQYIQLLWDKVLDQAKQHKKITPLMRDYLIDIRAAIENAFHHDLLSGPLRPAVRTFLERQREQKNELIIRPAPDMLLFGVKSSYPVTAQNLNAGLVNTINSHFSEQTVVEKINRGPLSPTLDLHLILQSIIKEDAQEAQPIVSGISCSYDVLSNIPHVITVTSNFGDAKALCDSTVPADTFFIHDNTVYPIIRKKPNRLVSDLDMMRSRLTPNAEQLQNQPSLNVQALREIARATQLLEEVNNGPVCLTFIKRDNTIYLLKVRTPAMPRATAPTFFDPLYTDEIPSGRKVTIIPIKPYHTLAVVKKRVKIILAPNVRLLVELLHKREKPEDVAVGIVKNMPAPQSKEVQMLANINFPVVWSPEFEQLRSWIDERSFPLVFDMQQKIAFQFTRCRGFCTLFQAIQNGIYAHPLTAEISVLPEFMLPLNPAEREKLKPDEYFSGVPLARLFDLLKTGSQVGAVSALNTILFRLQKQIAGEYITKKECAVSLAPFDMNRCERMEQMYAYVERVAYQLLMQLRRLYNAKTTPADSLEKNFLVNILQAVIEQKPQEHIIGSDSFMHVVGKA